jgi:hypothetical protein
VAFAEHHGTTNWGKVMFADSKYFYVSNRVSGKQWVTAGTRPTRQVVKHSAGVHVYAGFSAPGITPLIEVSGITGYRFPGAAPGRRGVSALEVPHALTQHLLPAGRQMFSGGKWQLLQDGAPPHRAATTTAVLAAERAQVVELWPGNSPDLNPIENLWSWVAQRLRYRNITTLAGAAAGCAQGHLGERACYAAQELGQQHAQAPRAGEGEVGPVHWLLRWAPAAVRAACILLW